MEQLLHYIWKHKIFPLKQLQTTKGMGVEVIDPGLSNSDSGPDFFNAKVKIGENMWVGNVEIHSKASDWFRHGHDKDKVYDSVILHVSILTVKLPVPTVNLFLRFSLAVPVKSNKTMSLCIAQICFLLAMMLSLKYQDLLFIPGCRFCKVRDLNIKQKPLMTD